MKLEPLIYVSDMNKSISFYTEILGLKLGELYPNKEEATYAPIFIGDYKLLLVSARDLNKKFYPNGLGGSGTQFFIRVDDVDSVWEKIKDKVGVKFDPIESKSWGDRGFTIKDPDGYLISFYTPTK